MTAAFFLLMVGVLFAYSGFKNVPFSSLIQGDLTPRASAFAGVDTQAGTSTAGGATTSTGSLPAGLVTIDGKPVAAWIAPYLIWARAHGWHGHVTSGYRTAAQQQALQGQSGPVAPVGKSNHESYVFPGGAVDVTDAATLARVLQGFPGPHLLVWAGSKDPVHFSHPHNGGY